MSRKSDGLRKTKSAIFYILIVLVVLTISFVMCFGAIRGKRIQPQSQNKIPEIDAPITGGNGVIIGDTIENGVSLNCVQIQRSDFAAMGVSETAESAYSLTATIAPENATNQKLTWSAAWVNPSAEWVLENGSRFQDYITVSDGNGKDCTVTCHAPFGEKIKVTVTSQDNPDAKADCTMDYAKRIVSSGVKFIQTAPNPTPYCYLDLSEKITPSPYVPMELGLISSPFTVVEEYNVATSAGTIEDEYSSTVTIRVTDEFASGLNAKDIAAVTTEFDAKGILITQTFFEQMFGAGLYSNPSKMNEFIMSVLMSTLSPQLTLNVTTVGTYSTLTTSYPLQIDSNKLTVRVTSVGVDNTSIIF